MLQSRKRTSEEISATPEAKAVRLAVRMVGSAAKVGRIVGRSTQAVQKWTEDPGKMDPILARALSRATGYKVPVSQMLPEVYGNLTLQEIGYLPEAYAETKP